MNNSKEQNVSVQTKRWGDSTEDSQRAPLSFGSVIKYGAPIPLYAPLSSFHLFSPFISTPPSFPTNSVLLFIYHPHLWFGHASCRSLPLHVFQKIVIGWNNRKTDPAEQVLEFGFCFISWSHKNWKLKQEAFSECRHPPYSWQDSQWLLAYHCCHPPIALKLSNIGLGLYLDGWPLWYVNFCW